MFKCTCTRLAPPLRSSVPLSAIKKVRATHKYDSIPVPTSPVHFKRVLPDELDGPPKEKPKRGRKSAKQVALERAVQTQGGLFEALNGVMPIARRPVLISEGSARDLVRAWGVDKMHDVTVVEPFAGPGGITKALLELKNVKKVIAMDESLRYMPFLEDLLAKNKDKDRLDVAQLDPTLWESYSAISDAGLLDGVKKKAWDKGVNDSIFLAAQIPNTRMGEKMIFLYLSMIADRMWYFHQFGRFRMGFLGATAHWEKILAPPGTPSHHKISVLSTSLADITTPSMSDLTPPEVHFHKPRGDPALVSPVLVTPKANLLAKDFDVLQFVTKSMFVSKGGAWTKGVESLAPGAANLIPKIQEKGLKNPLKIVNELTLEEWAIIANVFYDWPFKPNVLFDDQSFTPEYYM